MKQLRIHPVVCGLFAFTSLAGATPGEPESKPDAPVKVLILTGRNNHNWKTTTPAIRKILEDSGRFRVETLVPPDGLGEAELRKYDVILSDWNSWGGGAKQVEEAWTGAVREAYLGFVRGGKGHVTIHAGGSSFYETWPEYRKVSLVFWDKSVTNHPRAHEFKVRIDREDHPVTAGLGGFTTTDELWIKPGVVEGATVLASGFSPKREDGKGSGQWEPLALSSTYGQGRCFATLLGHDAKMMANKGFQDLLIRGVQWAATGKALDKASLR